MSVLHTSLIRKIAFIKLSMTFRQRLISTLFHIQHILGHRDSPNNIPWRKLEDKYCGLTLWSGSFNLEYAKERCIRDGQHGCESLYQGDGCTGDNYKLCTAGYIRDPFIGPDQPPNANAINGCVYTKGAIYK